MSDLYNYDRWPNFTKEELVCQETGEENPNVDEFKLLMVYVQMLRTWADIPFYVSSAYRAPEHSDEAKKLNGPGMHSKAAIDIRVPMRDCHRILKKAYELGFTGVGINLTGDPGQRFIHLDQRTSEPRAWSY